MRWLSCYCEHCRAETWTDPTAAAAAAGCENLDVVGPWKLVRTVRTDRAAYSTRQRVFKARGEVLAKELSGILAQDGVTCEEDVDKTTLRCGEPLAIIRTDHDECGFKWWAARITEPLAIATETITNKGERPTRIRRGDPYFAVQYVDRSPPACACHFDLGVGEEMCELYVHAKSLRGWIRPRSLDAASAAPCGPRTRAARARANLQRRPRITSVDFEADELVRVDRMIGHFEHYLGEPRGRWAAAAAAQGAGAGAGALS